jgi:hypothetical protein
MIKENKHMKKKTYFLFLFIFMMNDKKQKSRMRQSHGISSFTGENFTPILDIIDLVDR